MFLILGLVLPAAFVVLKELLNNTIRSETMLKDTVPSHLSV